MHIQRRRHGFGSVELIIALAIVCILTLIAMPFFTSFIQNYRLSAFADNLQVQLQYARTAAIEQNTNVYVSFVTGNTWCYGINAGSACTCTTPSGCSLGTGSYGAAKQVSLATSGFTGNNFYFEPTHGSSSVSGATVTYSLYSNSSTLITLTISAMGNIQICSTGVTGYTAC